MGRVVSRPNRFTAVVDVPGRAESERVHVHDPGRLEEILYSGNTVLLRHAGDRAPEMGGDRRTSWDLVAGWVKGEEEGSWVVVNSSYHRRMAERLFSTPSISPFGPAVDIRAEVTVGHSRLDFLVSPAAGRDILVETKGCTLARGDVALFPDAPTSRGKRHLEALVQAVEGGKRAAVVFLVFRPEAVRFAPNASTDPAFASTFVRALEAGVEAYAPVFRYLPLAHVEGSWKMPPDILVSVVEGGMDSGMEGGGGFGSEEVSGAVLFIRYIPVSSAP
ncbi:MAG: DNA/RNA nuclease SfsA [Thermoplasmata archaeon]|nr:DNA/RNA nuclease SfsA [Thermoplasmata archaeon]